MPAGAGRHDHRACEVDEDLRCRERQVTQVACLVTDAEVRRGRRPGRDLFSCDVADPEGADADRAAQLLTPLEPLDVVPELADQAGKVRDVLTGAHSPSDRSNVPRGVRVTEMDSCWSLTSTETLWRRYWLRMGRSSSESRTSMRVPGTSS